MNPNIENYAYRNCPECNSKSWTISNGEKYGLVKIDDSNKTNINNDNLLKVLPVVCKNCGYTKFYMDGQIYAFIKP